MVEDIKILYENKNIIFVVKDRGVPSQPSPTGAPSMVDLLSLHANTDVFCVHRLDTATGGVMVYAKTKKAAAFLSEAFRSGEAEKEYLAVVCGNTEGAGEMKDFLYHDKQKNKAFVVKNDRRGAKAARLTYEVLAASDEYSLVKVKLLTGRTHQIRVQFASRGMPLAGDGKYGGASGMPLALWCSSLTVPYFDNSKKTFTAAPPESEAIWKLFNTK